MIDAKYNAPGERSKLIEFPPRISSGRRLEPVDYSAAMAVKGRRRGWQPYSGPNLAFEWLADVDWTDLVLVEVDQHHGVRVHFRSGMACDMDSTGHRQVWGAQTMIDVYGVPKRKQPDPREVLCPECRKVHPYVQHSFRAWWK